jgi:alpha-mannosidase
MSKVEAHAIQKFEVHLLQEVTTGTSSELTWAANVAFEFACQIYTTKAKTKIWINHLLVD